MKTCPSCGVAVHVTSLARTGEPKHDKKANGVKEEEKKFPHHTHTFSVYNSQHIGVPFLPYVM